MRLGKGVLNVMRGHVFIIYALCEGALKKKLAPAAVYNRRRVASLGWVGAGSVN